MNSNSQSTSNSIKFAPMPISALLANLVHLEKQEHSPNCSSGSADESDNSIGKTVAKKPSPVSKFFFKNHKNLSQELLTPNLKSTEPMDKKTLVLEKKPVRTDNDKENTGESWISNQTYPNKDGNMHKPVSTVRIPSSEVKRSVLVPHNYGKKQCAVPKKTPDKLKLHSHIINFVQKSKTPTPKIKTGVRKFTPGSGKKTKHTPISGKKSQKASPQRKLANSRDRVRCELFTVNQKDEVQCPPSRSEPASAVAPVPETPMNRKPLCTSYSATPSHPQNVGGNPKILFKTITIKDKKYLFLKMLGKGGSSEVFKVLEVSTSAEFAVKCVYLGADQELAQGYINEVRLLRELQDSDRVIRLFDYEYDRSKQMLRIVLEAGETDLSSFLKARGGGAGLPPALVLHYWEEMLHAVHYIHEHGVIHADLKPANFLLVCGRLKLIDFGIASAISSDATSVVRSQATGTYSYISPEALMGGAGGYSHADGTAPIKISFRSDVWSLGCILYSLVFGRTPFGHIPNLAKLAAILDPNHRIDYPPAEHLPPSLIAALKWCLTYNARKRPTVRELLAIPYLQPASGPLPQPLLDKLQSLVTPQEFTILQRAQVSASDSAT